MRALLLAALATAATACFVPAQRGTPTTYASSTPVHSGGTDSVGGVGQSTTAVATPTGIAITASSASVPVARREPVTYAVNERSTYLVDPLTHTCVLVYAGNFYRFDPSQWGQASINAPLAITVDCATLKTSLPQIAYLIDWIPAAAPAVAAQPTPSAR